MSYDAILQVGKVEETACTILLNAQSEARDRVAAAHSAAEEQLASVKKTTRIGKCGSPDVGAGKE